MTTQNITVTARERDTLLAALRYYQFYRMQGHPFDPQTDDLIDTIAAGSGEALDVTEIDDLCAGLRGNRHAVGSLDAGLKLGRGARPAEDAFRSASL